MIRRMWLSAFRERPKRFSHNTQIHFGGRISLRVWLDNSCCGKENRKLQFNRSHKALKNDFLRWTARVGCDAALYKALALNLLEIWLRQLRMFSSLIGFANSSAFKWEKDEDMCGICGISVRDRATAAGNWKRKASIEMSSAELI